MLNYFTDKDGRLYRNAISVLSVLRYTHPGVIFPEAISEDLLGHFGIKRLRVEEDVTNKDHPYSYKIVEVAEDKSKVTVKYGINDELERQAWTKLREKRDALLQSSDWIEFSPIITESTRVRYRGYRQILRDITKINKYPCDISFPEPPAVVINQDEATKTITLKQYEDLKNSQDINFVKDWEKFDFTRNKLIVESILKMHGYTL
jgi:hypothetical protein